jgi:signal transduction histidine kinase
MNTGQVNILLVDDDPQDRRLVERILARSYAPGPYSVQPASTMSEAVQCLNRGRYDVVLLDLNLPDSNGIDTVQKARQVNSDAIVVVLTGLDDEETGIEAIKKGASDYLVKGKYLASLLVRTIRYSLERRRMEDQLRKHREYLELEVNKRTADLRNVNEQLRNEIEERKQIERELLIAKADAETANEAKSEFLANMSHELRTPLHSILSFASFGIKKHDRATPAKLLDYFSRIKESGKVLLALLNNLLDLAKLESRGAMFLFEPTDLRELMTSVMNEFDAMLSERGLSLRYEEPDFDEKVALDADKIKQVLRNLLNNAIKFSPPRGTIDVDMCHAGSSVSVSVRDQGPGIPPDELEAVFDKFVQSSKTKTGAGGTGLGLAICREIIAGHGGRIWAENSPDGGAVFFVEMPFSMDARMGTSHHSPVQPVTVPRNNDVDSGRGVMSARDARA